MSKVDLAELTHSLGEAYDAYKDAEKVFDGEPKKKKDRMPGLKERFLDAATEVAAQGTLAQKTVLVPSDVPDPASFALKRYPLFEVVGVEQHGRGHKVLMRENPKLRAFNYVNKEDKRVFTKQVRSGSPWLDDDELRERDPDLWRDVSVLANQEFIENILYEAGVDHRDIEAFITHKETLYEAERVMKPLESLSPDQLAAVQEYIYPGKPTVALAPPRDADPEELSEDDN